MKYVCDSVNSFKSMWINMIFISSRQLLYDEWVVSSRVECVCMGMYTKKKHTLYFICNFVIKTQLQEQNMYMGNNVERNMTLFPFATEIILLNFKHAILLQTDDFIYWLNFSTEVSNAHSDYFWVKFSESLLFIDASCYLFRISWWLSIFYRREQTL